MSGDSYQDCPGCTNHTAHPSAAGNLRCIPCGYGLTTIDGRTASPEQSRANADFLTGKDTNLRLVDGSRAEGKRGN